MNWIIYELSQCLFSTAYFFIPYMTYIEWLKNVIVSYVVHLYLLIFVIPYVTHEGYIMTQIIGTLIISLAAYGKRLLLIIINNVLKSLPIMILYFCRHKEHKLSSHQWIYSCCIQERSNPSFTHHNQNQYYS